MILWINGFDRVMCLVSVIEARLHVDTSVVGDLQGLSLLIDSQTHTRAAAAIHHIKSNVMNAKVQYD